MHKLPAERADQVRCGVDVLLLVVDVGVNYGDFWVVGEAGFEVVNNCGTEGEGGEVSRLVKSRWWAGAWE